MRMLTLKRFFIADLTLLITCLAIIWLSFDHPAAWATSASMMGPYLPSMGTASVAETKPESVKPTKGVAPVVAATAEKEVAKTRSTKSRLSSKALIPRGPATIPHLGYAPRMV